MKITKDERDRILCGPPFEFDEVEDLMNTVDTAVARAEAAEAACAAMRVAMIECQHATRLSDTCDDEIQEALDLADRALATDAGTALLARHAEEVAGLIALARHAEGYLELEAHLLSRRAAKTITELEDDAITDQLESLWHKLDSEGRQRVRLACAHRKTDPGPTIELPEGKNAKV